MVEQQERLSWAGLGHLAVLYVAWGSTYLAIRVAVRPDAGFPPFWLAALRLLVAGVLLLGWARLRRQPLGLGRVELRSLARSAVLLWVGGHGLVVWAEQHAHSGFAALLVGTLPLWAAAVEAALDRRLPGLRLVGALLVGFAGIVVLSTPVLRGGVTADLLAVLALVLAPASWGLGSVLQRREPLALPTAVSSGWQQLMGGAIFLVLSAATGEPLPSPTPAAWAAWAYLVVVGSLLAFTSFLAALRLLPTSVVMTYAYANPVIAVLLGRLILDEPVTAATVAGGALVVAGVAGVFHDRAWRAAREVAAPPPGAAGAAAHARREG